MTRYNPANRHQRKKPERFRHFAYDELIARDKASLDVFWLKDDSLDDLPPPDVLQQEIKWPNLRCTTAGSASLACSLTTMTASGPG